MLDKISYTKLPSYPKEVLLNAFYNKPEDETYLSVLSKWKEILEDKNFYGCEANIPAPPGNTRFITITKSVRHPDTWQLTYHDAIGPVMHETYSDTCKEATHRMDELIHKLAQYSANEEIIVKSHVAAVNQ